MSPEPPSSTTDASGTPAPPRAAPSGADEAEACRQLVEASDELLATADGDGRFDYLNPAGARLLGLAPGGWTGRHVYEFVLGDDVARVANAVATWLELGARRPLQVEARMLGADGRPHALAWTVLPRRDARGARAGFLLRMRAGAAGLGGAAQVRAGSARGAPGADGPAGAATRTSPDRTLAPDTPPSSRDPRRA